MRFRLKNMGIGKTYSFTALVSKFEQTGNSKKKMLITDIRHKGVFITDHLWILIGDDFSSLKLEVGCYIRFKSRIIMYQKRKNFTAHGWRVDYGLSHPVYMEVITEDEHLFAKKQFIKNRRKMK